MGNTIYSFGITSKPWDSITVGRFEAYIPHADKNNTLVADDFPKYIKVVIDKKTHILESSLQTQKVCFIHVHPKVCPRGRNLQEVSYTKASEKEFRKYVIANDRRRRLALFGLVIAFIGVLIDGSFALGEFGVVLISLSVLWTGLWMGLGIVLKLVGLYLVYEMGLRDKG